MPAFFQEDHPLKQRLKSTPVQKIPAPPAPQTENFLKYRLNVQIPKKVDLLTVKILWSKKMEDEETEKRRQEELRRQRELEHLRLTKLVAVCKEPKKADSGQVKRLLQVLDRAEIRPSTNREAPRKPLKRLIAELPVEIETEEKKAERQLLAMHKEFV